MIDIHYGLSDRSSRNLDDAFSLYVSTTSKGLEEAINAKLFDVAVQAYKRTLQVNRANLKTYLEKQVPEKTGVSPSGYQYKLPSKTLMEIITNKRRKSKGEPVYHGNQLTAKANRLKRIFLASAGFIRSMWLGPIKDLQPHVKSGKKLSFAGIRGQQKGHAIPARKVGNKVIGSIFINVENDDPHVHAVAINGVTAAMNYVTKDILRYLENSIRKATKKYD